MYRGLEFDHDSNITMMLNKLLKDIPIDQYSWYILEHEIISEMNNVILPDTISTIDFEHFIKRNNYSIISLNLQGFQKGEKRVEIETYDDFLLSKCEILILISDVTVIEIYVKSQIMLNQLLQNACDIGGKNIEIKTNKNDARVQMCVI